MKKDVVIERFSQSSRCHNILMLTFILTWINGLILIFKFTLASDYLINFIWYWYCDWLCKEKILEPGLILDSTLKSERTYCLEGLLRHKNHNCYYIGVGG